MKGVFKVFILWLVHECDGVEWDFGWNIFIGKTILNLVTLASVYKLSHRYLYRFYRKTYESYARILREYRMCTAWLNAVRDFDEDHTRTIDGISLMWELKGHEDEWGVQELCEQCELSKWVCLLLQTKTVISV